LVTFYRLTNRKLFVDLLEYLLSQGYEVNLPSSFLFILPSALVYSTSPPVSD
jgi:hypothetical protein